LQKTTKRMQDPYMQSKESYKRYAKANSARNLPVGKRGGSNAMQTVGDLIL